MTDDEILIEQFKKGDLSAFDELMKKHQNSIYYLALRKTGSHEDAQDIVQDVFVRVFNKLPSWKPKASFYTWLHTIAVNLCIDHHRKRSRRQTQSLENKRGIAIDVPTNTSDSPSKKAEIEELREKILTATEELSPRQRRAFILCKYGGLPLKDAAEAMGCKVGTIKAHLNRATEKMRDLLEDVVDDL